MPAATSGCSFGERFLGTYSIRSKMVGLDRLGGDDDVDDVDVGDVVDILMLMVALVKNDIMILVRQPHAFLCLPLFQ